MIASFSFYGKSWYYLNICRAAHTMNYKLFLVENKKDEDENEIKKL